MRVLAFTRSGPGVLQVDDALPPEWKLIDVARLSFAPLLPVDEDRHILMSEPQSIPMRRFERRFYTGFGLEALAWVRFAGHVVYRQGVSYFEQMAEGPQGVTVPVYVEVSV